MADLDALRPEVREAIDDIDDWCEEWKLWKKCGCKAVKVIVRREA